MKLSRRALLAATPAFAQTPAEPEPHLGSLYGFVQREADRAKQELSFLEPRFTNLRDWQTTARSFVFSHLFRMPPPAPGPAREVRRIQRDGYTEEWFTFEPTPGEQAPAYLLVPDGLKRPAPAMLALHDHGGFYLWGKEKILAQGNEHPVLTAYRQRYYSGRSITTDLARAGYVVMAIDMFYWGERRLRMAADPPPLAGRTLELKEDEITAFNRRSGANEALVARSLFTAGSSWPGVMMWDDIRSLDYLAARPEVDPRRIGCVGLSVGGYRSFLLAALDERIRAAIDVGWMTSFGSQIRRHVTSTVGLSFHVPGLFRYLDLPDLAALIAPRAVLVINGSRDTLFAPQGVTQAHEKIAAIYRKADVPNAQHCRVYDAPHEFNAEMQAMAWPWLQAAM